MAPRCVRYEAAGWGTGELWMEGQTLAWHELPRGRATRDLAYDPLAARFVSYLRGDAVSFADVAVVGDDDSDFSQELRRALRALPRGQVVTYGELAALAGRRGAARAAGTFCARNPVPIVVPCHRVVAAGGLGGYGSLGLEYKRRLLALEGVRL